MQKHEFSVLLFAKNPHVAFTNNRAERDVRMANKGHNPLIAIQMALAGELGEEG